MKFSTHLWKKNEPTYQQIINHPFIQDLTSGVLSKNRFHFYLQQDSYYLIQFSRVLSILASRAHSVHDMDLLIKFSREALIAEREIHAHFLSKTELKAEIDLSPACLAYSSFLLATATTSSYEESLAATLPCFWIYRDVGKYIAKTTKENNPYELWINSYSNEEFDLMTEQMISLVDQSASSLPNHRLTLMEKAFTYSTIYEWHFWNDAYQLKTFSGFAPKC